MSTSDSTRAPRSRFRPHRRQPDQYHHGDLRRALIDAALHLVERRGPDGFTLRETARVVGVSHTAPYRHFTDKAALLAAVALEGVNGMRTAMLDAIRNVTDPMARLEALGVAYVAYAVGHPAHFRVMYGKHLDGAAPDLKEVKQQKLGLLLESVAACQDAGVLPAGPPEPLALACWSAVHGLATLLIDGTLQGKHLVEGNAVEIARIVTRVLLTGGDRAAGAPEPRGIRPKLQTGRRRATKD